MDPAKRPRRPGLVALAVVNSLNFLAAVVFLWLRFTDVLEAPPGVVGTITGTLAGLFALLSAIGFITRSRTLGLGVGNVYAIYLFAYAVGFLVARGSDNPMEYFAWLSYPIVLLVAINVIYPGEFARVEPHGTRQEADGPL